MADKYPTINGNWSNPLIWNGLSLPTAADDVYADGKAVVIDTSVTVLSIRTTQRSGGTLGGTFTISAAGITVTCTSSGILSGTVAGGLLITATTGTTTINSNLTGGTGSNTMACVLSGATTLNITGNLLGGSNALTHALSVTSASTINITGNLTAGSNSGTGVLITAAATLNVTGNVIGGSNAAAYGINNTTLGATINITGNVTGQTAAGILSAVASVVTVKGIITSSNTISGVSLSSASTLFTFSGVAVNNNGVMAIYSPVLKLYTSDTVQWTFQNTTGGNKILYQAGTALGNPATTDVRSGITYGASSELTGTLIVPSPSNVLSGVQTDNTVGTYSTTPALIATEIFTKLLSNSDFSTSGSFGKLIKDNVDAKSSDIKAKTDLIPTNPASVQSVGAIVASYNV